MKSSTKGHQLLHFTLGPIQDFIAQARRTRDLWGGSFLLSWLSGIAMKQVIESGGCIVFPAVHDNERNPTDEILAAIFDPKKALSGKKSPIIGSLPTRFKAEVPNDCDVKVKVADVVTKTFKDAAERILESYVEDVESCGNGTRAIWDRQINNFWEIAWVLGDDPGDGNDIHWLDARKNWRVPASTEPEGGDHCTVMHAWQELSGWVRATHRKKQDDFWAALRTKVGKLDLRPDERLCAIAFVKRMLPKLAREDEKIFGWKMDSRNWPSTAYMAAVPWIKEAWDKDKVRALALTGLVVDSFEDGAFPERGSRIKCLTEVDADFRSLDGNAFHLTALDNEDATPLKPGADRKALKSALKKLQEATERPASPFYALLLMDGDSLGSMLHDHSEKKVSASLAKFTHRVDDIVSQHNGVTVYARHAAVAGRH